MAIFFSGLCPTFNCETCSPLYPICNVMGKREGKREDTSIHPYAYYVV